MNFKLLLDWAVLTVSFFNAISLFWLGLMVVLIGNRRSAGTWLTGSGLLLGALFFTSHTAILGRGLAETGFGMNFWWWVSWTPAIAAPFAWYAAMLWYTGYRPNRPHPHRAWLGVIAALVVGVLLLLIFANPLPSYQFVAGRVLLITPSVGDFPLLILAYLAYSLLCYLLPLDLLRQPGVENFPLETLSRRRARPWLMGASLAMLLAALILAWTATWALLATPAPSLSNPGVEQIVKAFDLAVAFLVALAVTLLGRSIVAYEVFTGRPLPRDRFFSQWRSTVLLAGGFGAVAAFTIVIDLRPVYSLMLATSLMTLFFALFSWRSFTEREAFMTRLRPFLASQNLYDRLTRTPDSQPTDQAARALFETLCRDLLGAQVGVLVPARRLAALVGPPLAYPGGERASIPALSTTFEELPSHLRCLSTGDERLPWAVPLWTKEMPAGVLFLGEKSSGGPYSEEEIELAQAGSERLLDLLAGSEMARISLDLLRQRLMEARVLEGQGRRVLHDEVLPELHTAMLYLSQPVGAEAGAAVEILGVAHRRISDLLRASTPDVPARLARDGVIPALRALLDADFASEFAAVHWNIDPEAEARSRGLSPFAAEAVYFAAREVVRNAVRYARGDDAGRGLNLSIRLERQNERLQLEICDDGIGLDVGIGRPGAGNGLRIHSAMLAAVGASLEVSPATTGGTRVVIFVFPSDLG